MKLSKEVAEQAVKQLKELLIEVQEEDHLEGLSVQIGSGDNPTFLFQAFTKPQEK